MARYAARRTVITALVAIATVLSTGTVARAQPTPAEIEKQIDEAWVKLEPIAEKHNATRQDLAVKREKAQALAKKIAPLQLQIDLAMAKVGEYAAEQYKGGNFSALNAILTTGSPTTFANQLEILDVFARRSQADIQQVVELRERYAAQKEPLDVLVGQLTEEEAQLAAKKKQIDTEITKLEKMRLDAYGAGGGVGALRPAACPVSYDGSAGTKAAKFACAQIGKSYVFGSEGPNSYDCSGLTMKAWSAAGVGLPHNAARQRNSVPSVSRSNLKVGDLVFYYSDLHHVGIYVGGGYIVDASKPGVPIKMRTINAAPIHSYGRPG
ncbi:C40 family peptidase [Phytohabitans kaempferiae]|uniref:NlpC/P60 family protein n=1 Tax=Phytohabitans kaempferiae TaxID=1620943 RepID=A0ABV6MDP0_9ACTN